MFRPKLIVQGASELTPTVLGRCGVRAVMVDLDDTLVAVGGHVLEPHLRSWLESLQAAYIPVLILSNGEKRRVARWSDTLGVPALGLCGKPFAFAFRRGLRLLGTSAGETAMVGDQLFTDVLGANLAGMVSILVTPLSGGGLPHTRAARGLERLILKNVRRNPRASPVHR